MLASDIHQRALAEPLEPDLSPQAVPVAASRSQPVTGAKQAEAVYFLHIEKTAGTSVHKFLLDRLSKTDLCPSRLIDHLEGASAESLRPYRVFSGHFTGGLSDFLGLPLKTVTLLRDPVQRSISQYAHIRRDPLAEHHQLAQGLSLKEFCLHPATQPLIQDYQARCLAGEAQDIPFRRVIRANMPGSDFEREQLLRRARARLADCAAVGVTEHLTATLEVFCAALGLEWSGTAPYENPSYNRPKTIDRETLSIIRELTQCDAVLHKEATRMLFERARELGAPVECPLKSFKTVPGKAGPAGLQGVIAAARATWPERGHRIKLSLSAAICRLPRMVRMALVLPYTTYRLLVDRTGSSVRRLPLVFGILYLVLPFDLSSVGIPVPGHWDKAAALILGFLLSMSLSGKRMMRDVKLGAIARFNL
jgi:hypothetical protein